ncbi:MAG: hypothetical protein ACLTBV_22375 [Enterocloster bolteae]
MTGCFYCRRIESEMRSHLVEMAAQDDYDYVTYIDANTNHHIRYLSSHSSENLLPLRWATITKRSSWNTTGPIFLWMNGKKPPVL